MSHSPRMLNDTSRHSVFVKGTNEWMNAFVLIFIGHLRRIQLVYFPLVWFGHFIKTNLFQFKSIHSLIKITTWASSSFSKLVCYTPHVYNSNPWFGYLKISFELQLLVLRLLYFISVWALRTQHKSHVLCKFSLTSCPPTHRIVFLVGSFLFYST